MLFLVLLPLLLLFVPTNIPGVLSGTLIYMVVCFGANRYCKKHNIVISFVLRNPVRLALLSIILACMFYKRWIPSEKVLMVASLLHIQVKLFLGIVSVILTVLAMWSFNALKPILGSLQKEEEAYYISPKYRHNYIEVIRGKYLFFLFLIAVVTMTICTKSSPIYPFNDWVDSNAFFTVGKSMISGVVPYRDLFEHKGPLLYMLHAFAAMISYDSFLGMYFIEILFCFAFLTICFCLLKMYIDSDKDILLILSIAAIFIYTSKAFYYGDSAEELCMPFLAYGLWVSVKALRNNELPSAKDGFWIGITSACVLWIKFNILGFYIGWIIVPAYLAFKNNKVKKLIKLLGSIILGITCVTIPIVIYFGSNQAITDLLQVYFYNNLFSYTTTRSGVAAFATTSNLLDGLLSLETNSLFIFLLVIIGMIWCARCENRTVFYHFCFTFAFTFLFVYIGGRYYDYYAMIFNVFVMWGMIWLLDVCKRIFTMHMKKNECRYKVVWMFSFVVLVFMLCPNTDMLKHDKNELPHYQIKREIEQSGKENPTLLNYGCLDAGIYTVCGIQPTCKYFYSSNLVLPEIKEGQDYYADNGLIDFIVTTKEQVDFKHYDLIGNYEYNSEKIPQILYLYQLKE